MWQYSIELASPKEFIRHTATGVANSRGEAFESAKRHLDILYIANTPRQGQPFDLLIELTEVPDEQPSLEQLGF